MGLSLPCTTYSRTSEDRSGVTWNCDIWKRLLLGVFLHFLTMQPKCSDASEASMLTDLQVLASALPGCYSNIQQYHKHAQRGLPPNKRHLLIRSEVYRMTTPMFNDSLTFYFQDFTKASSQPFRAGFYSFSLEKKLNILRMKSLKLKRGLFTKAAYLKRPDFTLSSTYATEILNSQGVNVTDFRTYSACDMYWKRLAERTFVGITGPLCLGTLGTDQVKIGVSMTLTTDRLLLTEGWYRVKDGTRITEVKVPYVLQKIKASGIKLKKAKQSKEKLSASILDIDEHLGTLRPLQDDWSPETPKSRRHKGIDRSSKKFRKRASDRKKRRTSRNLRHFREVAAALTSGYSVYFRVELSACAAPQQVRVERLSFGGKVKDFLFVRRDGSKNKRKDYIFFTTRATVTGSQGPMEITRQITLLREGYIRVEVIKVFPDPSKVRTSYTFDCRLYSDQTGYGGVKMSVDPSKQVKRVNKFRALTSAVDKGRDLHVVADLARCHGTSSRPAVVVGSHVTEYDLLNDGKTVEVFLPLVDNISSRDEEVTPTSTHREGFITQVFKDGDVMLTRVSSQSTFGLGRGFPVSPAYHCKLSNRNAVITNDDGEHSVKIFHTK